MIVSADAYNRSELRTVTVVVLTTTTQLAALPGNVTVPAGIDVVDADSVVNVTRIATVDRRALEGRIGALPDWLMAHVDASLGALLRSHLSGSRDPPTTAPPFARRGHPAERG